MVRGVAKKVMWVGRATVFLVGLAVIVAVVFFGVSTMVLGSNAATSITKLAGAAEVNGPMHQVHYKTPGTRTTSKSGGAQTLWAVIHADGTTARSSGVRSSKKDTPASTGEYDVIFKRNVSGCAYVASFADERQTGEVSASSLGPGTPKGVYVQTVSSNGTNEVYRDSPFHLAVFC
jgi:hypothetical protein